MSYGLKYTLTFRDLLPITYSGAMGQLWKVNIYENGYGGSSSSVIGTDSPVTLNYKKQELISPLCGSELTISLMAMSNNQYDEFLTAEPLQYYVDILKSTNNGSSYSTYWSGVNTTDTYTENYSSAPYPINLKFNDGLGELQWHRYENSGVLFIGNEQVIQVVNNIMTFLPYQKNVREIINIRADGMNDTLGLLEQLYLSDFAFMEVGDDGVVHGINCNTLLSKILTALNCRMYQSNNKWYIERIYERTNNSLKYFDYTMTGGVLTTNLISNIGSGTENKLTVISNTSFPKIVQGSELAVTKKQPALAYKLDDTAYANIQLINNPFFENNPTAVTLVSGKPEPLRWDRSLSVASLGGDQIETVNPYTSDPHYQTGYSFGSSIIASNLTQLNSAVGWWYGNMISIPSTYLIHSVLRPGDTWSQPSVFLDFDNGSLSVNIQQYIAITVTIAPGLTSSSDMLKSANSLFNMAFSPMFRMAVQAPSGITSYAAYYMEVNTWNTNANNYFGLGSNTATTNGLFSCWYPGPPGGGTTAVPLTLTNMLNLVTQAANKGSGGTFTLYFRTSNSSTNNLNAITSGSGLCKFDFKVHPPWYDSSQTTKLSPKTSWVISDYAINCIDIQYKDQNNSASSYIGFYNTGDENLRWNELTVNSTIGDATNSGYPGCFRFSTGAMTGTWHEMGKSYIFNTSTSSGNPGTGKISMNNAVAASVTHVYINRTDSNAFDDSVWLSTMAGYTLGLTDGTNVVFLTVNAVTAFAAYFDMTVTYYNLIGSFPFASGASLYVIYSGVVLADILFSKYIQLSGNYRHNLKAKIIGVIDYWQTVQDEDGRNYILLGHQLNVKSGQITSDMEEMSDTQLPVTHVIVGTGQLGITMASSVPITGVKTAPLGNKTTAVVSKSATVTAITPYPL